MVSPEALARKQKFLELKQEHDDIQGVLSFYKDLSWKLWYDDFGNIVSASKEDNESLDKVYKKAEFTNEQVDIVKFNNGKKVEGDWSFYKISTDKFDDSIKYLEVKTIEKTPTLSNLDLTLVDFIKTRQYNIKMKMKDDKLQVTLHDALIKKYQAITKEHSVIKGRRTIPIYLTSKNDPSFLFHKTSVSLLDLIDKGTITITVPEHLKDCSIYTLNLFDTYIRE